ncbi:hypothetical protein [Shouchella patagoniensis]|uniref:hypothetical protein n=1 Tax=Shouchella patagoniensis TaxID=228576 RepID=UPI000994B33C|nr:hypothetical protein [Shouchella patagoniensis]
MIDCSSEDSNEAKLQEWLTLSEDLIYYEAFLSTLASTLFFIAIKIERDVSRHQHSTNTSAGADDTDDIQLFFAASASPHSRRGAQSIDKQLNDVQAEIDYVHGEIVSIQQQISLLSKR